MCSKNTPLYILILPKMVTKIHAHPLMDDQDIPYNRYAVEGPHGSLLQLAKRMHSHHTATRSDQAQRKPNH
jgi:hypothetical protein